MTRWCVILWLWGATSLGRSEYRVFLRRIRYGHSVPWDGTFLEDRSSEKLTITSGPFLNHQPSAIGPRKAWGGEGLLLALSLHEHVVGGHDIWSWYSYPSINSCRTTYPSLDYSKFEDARYKSSWFPQAPCGGIDVNLTWFLTDIECDTVRRATLKCLVTHFVWLFWKETSGDGVISSETFRLQRFSGPWWRMHQTW